MRLTLWQQFSSNHSADFNIVGTFESVEKAEHVAEEFRSIIRKVYSWWQEADKEKSDEWWGRIHEGEITPVEQELSQQFDVEWSTGVHVGDYLLGRPHGIDYVYTAPTNPSAESAAQHHVSQFENRVMVRAHDDTEVNSAPFRQLMERYGGTVEGSEGAYVYEFFLYVTAIAPDEKAAQELIEERNNYPDNQPFYMEEKNPIYLDASPVRDSNRVFYCFNISSREPPWEFIVKMRAYLAAHACEMRVNFNRPRDYHF